MRSTRCGASYSTIVRRSAASSARRSRRARPDRGRKPSKTNRPAGSPLVTSAWTSGRRTRDRRHLVPGVEHGAGQPLAGVADAGRAGVGDDGHVTALAEHVEHLAEPGQLGVLVAHGQPGGADPGVLEQPAGPAGVLAADQPGPGERLDGPRREVAEVADRGGDEDEPARRRALVSHRGAGRGARSSAGGVAAGCHRRCAARRRRRRAGPTARTPRPRPRSPTTPGCTGHPTRCRPMRTILTTVSAAST